MRKLSFTLLAMLCFSVFSCKSQSNMKNSLMETEIKNVVKAFANAGEERNVAAYDAILHQNFRVIANQYPTPDKTSIIPLEGYVGLIEKGVIGGTKFDILFKQINIADHSATVLAHFKTAEGGGQLVTLLLVKNQDGKWQLIADMATQIKG